MIGTTPLGGVPNVMMDLSGACNSERNAAAVNRRTVGGDE
jgi:hypothetical protein